MRKYKKSIIISHIGLGGTCTSANTMLYTGQTVRPKTSDEEQNKKHFKVIEELKEKIETLRNSLKVNHIKNSTKRFNKEDLFEAYKGASTISDETELRNEFNQWFKYKFENESE